MITVDPAVIVLATLGASLLLFITDALRYEIVALLVVLALAITGCLRPSEAFQGFASPAVVLIGSMYVFGHAVTRWGLAEILSQRLLAGKTSEGLLAFRVCLVSGILSSLLSNTGVVAALIPVLSNVARKVEVPASRLMMPLAFGSLVGGTVTLLGTSHNVAVNALLTDRGIEPFGLFDFSLIGLALVVLCSLYFLGPGRLLLPRSRVSETLSDHYQVRKFVTEVLVEPSSTLINRAVAETDLFSRYGISVLGIVRPDAKDVTLAPGPYNRIRSDDTLILQGEPDAIVRLRQDLGLREVESIETDQMRLASQDVRLVEAVVPAGSEFIGRTLRDADFRARTGMNVMAISRHGALRQDQLTQSALDTGDTLLIQGHLRDIERARRERALLILDELPITPLGPGAVITLAMLGLVLVLTAFTGLDLSVSALLGAVGLILFGVVRPDDAIRAVSWPILILIGGMLALGKAFEMYGLAAQVAHWIAGLGTVSQAPYFLIAALVGTTILLTQVINNVSTAMIMTPVALSLAQEVGGSDRPFLLAVVLGASLSFASPVAHQANAMVMGPGDYKYKDYLRVGVLLSVLLGTATVFLIDWLG